MKKYILIVLVIYSVGVNAQYSETIRSGRPGVSIGPFTVGKDVFQIQSGVDYFGSDNHAGAIQRGYLTNHVLRYGLTRFFELSGVAEFKAIERNSFFQKNNLSGLSAADLGFRTDLFEGKDGIPTVGFQFRLRMNVLSDDYEINNVAPRFWIATNQKIFSDISLITNTGGVWDGNTSVPGWFYIVNFSKGIGEKWGVFIENYGNIKNGVFEQRNDGGISYLVNKDFQLDLSGGYGKNHGVSDFFVSAGISWRTKFLRSAQSKIQ